jgi:hypothetical protein
LGAGLLPGGAAGAVGVGIDVTGSVTGWDSSRLVSEKLVKDPARASTRHAVVLPQGSSVLTEVALPASTVRPLPSSSR